ncbi:hypothetical protein QE152_g7166 [Popillia japonica]|uniref:Uncharacterized protein n=1 Tax=Popillia japonica TaxID=7064 RepID=A0AAW1MFP3_POPJA
MRKNGPHRESRNCQHESLTGKCWKKRASPNTTSKQKLITDWKAYNYNVEIRLCNMTKEERSSNSICTDVIKESYTNTSLKGPEGERNVPNCAGEETATRRD